VLVVCSCIYLMVYVIISLHLFVVFKHRDSHIFVSLRVYLCFSCLFIYLFIYSFTCLSTCSFIYLLMCLLVTYSFVYCLCAIIVIYLCLCSFVYLLVFMYVYIYFTRSQWPRGLRHVWSSTARTLGFESRSGHRYVSMFLCVVLSCAGSGLTSGWSPVQGVLPNVQIDS
jgi:hypothetical protein